MYFPIIFLDLTCVLCCIQAAVVFSGTIITRVNNDKCIDLYSRESVCMDLYIHGSEISVSGMFLMHFTTHA